MRVIVLGTSDFTKAVASGLRRGGAEIAAIVSLPQAALPLNSTDLKSLAAGFGADYLEVADINSAGARRALAAYGADFLMSTWPKILSAQTLRVPRRFVIGSHPTDLPHNRGRHPLHWLVDLGIARSKLSFFLMDEGVDTGRVLAKEPFAVGTTIGRAVAAMNAAGEAGAFKLARRLRREPRYRGSAQPRRGANYWRRRTPHDVTIDPRMAAAAIVRLVRSFGPPYPCANLIIGDQALKVADAREVPLRGTQSRYEPGKIIAIGRRSVTMKAGDKNVALALLKDVPYKLRSTRYVHPPARYLSEFSASLLPRLAA